MTFVIVYTVLFPVVLNTVLGVESVPASCTGRRSRLGASRRASSGRSRCPARFPTSSPGLRNGLGYGWRALIAAEMIVGTSGIGFLMFDARRAGSTVEILLGMIMLGITLVHRRRLDSGADRARHRPALGIGDVVKSLSLRNLCEDLFRRRMRGRMSPPSTTSRSTSNRESSSRSSDRPAAARPPSST
jgi:hypothetical protein